MTLCLFMNFIVLFSVTLLMTFAIGSVVINISFVPVSMKGYYGSYFKYIGEMPVEKQEFTMCFIGVKGEEWYHILTVLLVVESWCRVF